jgi:hypothetical protein
VLFCVWVSRDFALPLQDYTSAFLVFSLLTITCQSRNFRVSFVFLGRFCRSLTLRDTSVAELLPFTGVQSDHLSPVVRSGSTSFRAVINLVSFISHRPSHCITIHGRGESDWTGLRSHAQWIRRYSHPSELRSQHALVIYILLLARMTSWVAHNDVYTGVGLLHFASYAVFPRMSTCGFLLRGILHDATFFS